MTQITHTQVWCRDRLFVKLARPGIAPDGSIRLKRFPYKARDKLWLPAVMVGCRADVSDLTGMKAIRFGMLLAAVNVQAGLVS